MTAEFVDVGAGNADAHSGGVDVEARIVLATGSPAHVPAEALRCAAQRPSKHAELPMRRGSQAP